MAKHIARFFGIISMVLGMAGPGSGQNCTTTVVAFTETSPRDVFQLISVPIGLRNTCKVGGLQLWITTSPRDILSPIGIELTDSSRIGYWEYVHDTVRVDTLIVTAIADYPNEIQTPPLDTGEGFLFNVLFQFDCTFVEDTAVTVVIVSMVVSDSTGYVLYPVTKVNTLVYIGEEVNDSLRGDANCDYRVTGADVIKLVNYFRGIGCPCTLCSGDANSNGIITGSDVTFLVNFLRQIGVPPGPCGP